MDGEEGDVCSGGSAEKYDYCTDGHWDVCTSLRGNLYLCEEGMAKEGDNFDVEIVDEGKSWASVVVDGYYSTLMEIRENYCYCDIHCR